MSDPKTVKTGDLRGLRGVDEMIQLQFTRWDEIKWRTKHGIGGCFLILCIPLPRKLRNRIFTAVERWADT